MKRPVDVCLSEPRECSVCHEPVPVDLGKRSTCSAECLRVARVIRFNRGRPLPLGERRAAR